MKVKPLVASCWAVIRPPRHDGDAPRYALSKDGPAVFYNREAAQEFADKLNAGIEGANYLVASVWITDRPPIDCVANGKKGGPARAAKLSPERRKEIGRMGARARWDKRNG